MFMYSDSFTPEEKMVLRFATTYLAFCPHVQAFDYGVDLFGGTTPLRDVRPWKRTPLWHARKSGPPSNYDVSIDLDFNDQAEFEAYVAGEVHEESAGYKEWMWRQEFTARVDWWYDGPPIIKRGTVHHESMWLWDDGVSDSAKEHAKDALSSLQKSVPSVRRVMVGDNVGTLTTDYDLIMDVLFDDPGGAKDFFQHPAQKEVDSLMAGVTKYEWTARITTESTGMLSL
jgi:hypothetical protein